MGHSLYTDYTCLMIKGLFDELPTCCIIVKRPVVAHLAALIPDAIYDSA